jgi:hypothetical protein
MTQGQSIQFELYDQDGTLVARASKSVPANGHAALFVSQLEWDSAPDWTQFEGIIKASAASDFAATMILVAPNQLATLPVTPIQ